MLPSMLRSCALVEPRCTLVPLVSEAEVWLPMVRAVELREVVSPTGVGGKGLLVFSIFIGYSPSHLHVYDTTSAGDR
jgi:hypothetical protein